ncbi:PP2C family protein-serine/threonine phosphatase [Candidatus Peregrinibacteria bacterium]|nr:MAG: PP2C family protein-serine/threonine phosphatase [Candidatus Peregrinibacteria bacterium]
MTFFRDRLIKKAFLFYLVVLGVSSAVAIVLIRIGIEVLPLTLFFGVVLGLLFFILLVYLWNVVWPIGRLTVQVQNLLTGKNYEKVTPTTVDEIGIMTHFFNEITHDLEKISYDIKDRKRMSSELDIAAQIQRDVLPKQAPSFVGLDIVAKTRSAAEVGGDSFDFLTTPDGAQSYVYIGDVTGHGVPAGLVMVMVNTLIHAMVSMGMGSAREVVSHTNALLMPRISNRIFMTLVMFRWSVAEQKLFYTGAGHEHFLIYRARTETVETIQSGGIALGMVPDMAPLAKEVEVPLEPGDVIVLYTDGLTEAKNQSGEMYGLERIEHSLKENGYFPSAEGIFDHLTKDFSEFVGPYVQVDDLTMIVMKFTGKTEQTQIKLTVNADEPKNHTDQWGWGS